MEPVTREPVTVRDRLGGKRALSWQAVVIGDVLIIVLAMLLTVASPGDRRALEAVVDAFAITTATAIIVAIYTAVAHLTVFRNREERPVPVALAVGFHLSIGVIFVIGFAMGAEVLGVAQLGGSARFTIAVLAGGLLVCLPTSVLLDQTDRYRASRRELVERVVDLERLRISEWSLRRALRGLVTRVDDGAAASDLTERLDTLELSEDVQVSTQQLWEVSHDHHQSQGLAWMTDDAPTSQATSPDQGFSDPIADRVGRSFPYVTWRDQLRAAFVTPIRFPVTAGLLTLVVTWILIRVVSSSEVALSISALTAVGVVLSAILRKRTLPGADRNPWVFFITLCAWGAVSAIGVAVIGSPTPAAAEILLVSLMSVIGTGIAVFLMGWASAVFSARDRQMRDLESQIQRRQQESEAVFASVSSIVTKMAGEPPLTNSAVIAACATGLQRVQRDMSPQHARRIIDWTESVVSAPGALPAGTLMAQLEEVVHPWRALAEITVECSGLDHTGVVESDVVAVVDEAVRNACRHGEAESIWIRVSSESPDLIQVVVDDDGSGPGEGEPGMGLERFATLGTAGFEITSRSPEPGTRVALAMDTAARGLS